MNTLRYPQNAAGIFFFIQLIDDIMICYIPDRQKAVFTRMWFSSPIPSGVKVTGTTIICFLNFRIKNLTNRLIYFIFGVRFYYR